MNTVAQALTSKRLLSTSAPSREIGANRPPCLSKGARHANSARLPPMNSSRIARMKTPRVRVGGDGVHRGQHGRVHEECADEGEREGQDREQDGAYLERVALLPHEGGVKERS